MTSASDILSADLTTVGRTLKSGFAWWTGELAGMIPARWRSLADTRPALSAQRGPDGDYVFARGDRRVMARPRPGTRVTLLLPPDGVLEHEVSLPAMADDDVRRLIALDIDRLTPFRPETVLVDVAFVRGPGDGAGRRRVAIAVVDRAAADLAVEEARSAGLDPRAVGVAGPTGDHGPFDFLPAMRQARGERPNRARLYAWGAVAFLLLINLMVATLRDVGDIKRLHAVVDAQHGPRDATLRLRRQVWEEAARRALIIQGHGQGEPLRVIDAVTRALPDGAWTQRLSWNGKAVRLAGYRQDNVDVAAALRASPLLANVRNSTGDSLARMAAGQPFDITADVVGVDGVRTPR